MRVRDRDQMVHARIPERVARKLDLLVAKKQATQSEGPVRRLKKFTLSDAINLAILNYIASEEGK
jgi:hypothetical protein